jgi:phosphoribosylamine--glycine ligase
LIEKFIPGVEATFTVMSDGTHALQLATAEDNKRLLAGDKGDNTGGTGALSPSSVLTLEQNRQIMQEIVIPVIEGMKQEGIPFVGFLYVGVMIDPDGKIWVIEFNVRFGDPEAEVVLMRLKGSLVELIQLALSKTWDNVYLRWDDRPALGVVVMAKGYPDAPRKGDVVTVLPLPDVDYAHFFWGGVKMVGDQFVTDGGRVGIAVALGSDLEEAQTAAYELARKVHFSDMYFRTDIGNRALARLAK